ncbi:MAG: DUF4421 family protein [Bacteroidota bacterium]
MNFTILLIGLVPILNYSQSDSLQLKTNHKGPNWDTIKYEKFNYVLIVGYFQQYRNFTNEISQTVNKDSLNLSSTPLIAESRLISGLVFNYDKFQIQFGTGTKPQDNSNGKPESKVFNLGFTFGDNRWVAETYFRRFKSFYNDNSFNIDSVRRKTSAYIASPNLITSLFLARASYFTNYDNFSYKAGYGCNFRQRKSAASWILQGSISNFQLKNDSSLFASPSQKYYNEYANLNYINSLNIGAGGGAAISLVLFKAWFINLQGTLGPEIQFRKYNLNPGERSMTAISWSGFAKVSFGLNLKRCYFISAFSTDYLLINNSVFRNTAKSQNASFTFGWRFHTGAPKPWYQKFQKTKIYNLF